MVFNKVYLLVDMYVQRKITDLREISNTLRQ